MEQVQLQLGKDNPKPGEAWWRRIGRAVINRKLQHPLVIFFLFSAALLFSGLMAFTGVVAPLLIVVLCAGLSIAACVIIYPRFGILVMLIVAYFIMWVLRIGVNFPLGTLMDGLQGLLIFGFLLKIKQRRDWKVFKGPVSFMILIWIAYNLLQVVNPAAESRMAWIYTLRSVALLMLTYFIFFYQIRTVNFIKLIFKVWIALSVFAALYGLYQEIFGYLPFEQRWVDSDPQIADLYFIAGHWRKFSIFSDPVAFAYNMVVSSVLCFCISTGPIAAWKKAILIGLGILFILSMLSSGTRGAYVLLPAALGMFCILRFNKRMLLYAGIAGVIMAGLIIMPTGSPTLIRFQSAFKPAEDASFNLRSINQKKIQPFIQTHPMGGGLGATGVWGQRFAPDSYLANFPPDSGYVRVAVELGWIGLFIFCMLMFTILRTGINNYYSIKDKELKSYCLAMTLIVFALNIGNYPQEALVQFPTNIYFYLEVALINVLPVLDKQKHASLPATA